MISIIMPIAPNATIKYISFTLDSISQQTSREWYIYICIPFDMKESINNITNMPINCECIVLPSVFVSKYGFAGSRHATYNFVLYVT